VFDSIQDALLARHQNAVVLYGQRRVGKTSILKEIPNRLPADIFEFVYFELSGQAALPINEVLYNLAYEIATSLTLEAPAQARFQSNGKFFQSGFLPQVYSRLGKKRLLLLMDEFDVLSDWSQQSETEIAANALFPYLRKLLNTEKQLAFIFVVGRRLEELPRILLRIFKGAQSERIWLLRQEDAVKLIQEPVLGLLEHQADAIKAILALTSGHPYFTQLICYELFNYMTRQRRVKVTAKDIPEVTEHALGTGEPAFAWLWDGFNPGTQLLISAVAQLKKQREKADSDSIQAVLRANRLKPPVRDWQTSLQDLVEWGLLKRGPDDGLEFTVELIYRWVLARHPLSKMMTETSEDVSRLFRSAQQARNEGDLTTAVDYYRRVLETHPNHLRAQLELGATLLSKSDRLEAVKAYEDAYWQDPYSSKEGLITARLAYAEDLEKGGKYDKAAIQYQEILEIDENNSRVRAMLDLLHRRRIRRISFFAGGAVAILILVVILGALSLKDNRLAVMVGLITRTPTATSTITSTPAPTQTPVYIVVTATPKQIATPTETRAPAVTTAPTDQPTATQTPEEPTHTPSPLPITNTPTLSVTETPTTPVIYDAPQLLAPDDEADFAGELAFIELKWEPIPDLKENEFYSLSLHYQREGKPVYAGGEITETSWLVPWEMFYLQADGPERRYEWDVTVYRRLTNGSTQPVSQTSETRAFFWIE
jgi:tetratricopeptide (TPR) repeat protein